MKQTFVEGQEYTRRQIHDMVGGGGLQDFLPHKDGRVLCGAFIPKLNPELPEIILVGEGREKWAEVFHRQGRQPIPIFEKVGSGRWKYHGDYWVKQPIDSPNEIAKYAKDSGRTDVTLVLKLENSDMVKAIVRRDLKAIQLEDKYVEGQRTKRLVSYYERNAGLRSRAVAVHGTRCQVCGMSFDEQYGDLGEGFIEVHHLKPVSSYKVKVRVDPNTDMAVVCPNCHRMLHRQANKPLSIEELRCILKNSRRRR
jgi:hypothetical protein